MTQEELQQKIAKARQLGIPDDVIRQRIGTSINEGKISLPQSGSMPSGSPKIAQEQKGWSTGNGIIDTLFSAPARLGKGIGTFASNLVNPIGFTKDKETKEMQDRAELMAQQAEAKGDFEGARRLRSTISGSQDVNSQIEQRRTDSNLTAGEDILKGGVGTGAYFLGGGFPKAILGGAMTGFGTSERGQELSSTAGGAVIGGGLNVAGKGLKWLGGKFTKDIIQASGTSQNKIVQKFGKTVEELVSKYGKNPDELLGPVSSKNRGGTFNTAMTDAEKIIQDTVKTAGSDIRIGGKDVIKAWEKIANQEKKSLGTTGQRAIDAITTQIKKKYGTGVTAKTAERILRAANAELGKVMATTSTKGSTAMVARKIEAQVMRDSLKKMFPEVADALQTQSEILELRPIVEKARGSTLTNKGVDLSKFDLVKPGTWPGVQPSVDVLGGIGGKLVGVGGRIIEEPTIQKGAINVLMGQGEQPTMSETPMETPVDNLPTPQGTSLPEGLAKPQSSGPTKEDFQRAYIEDIQRTGGKNTAKIKAMADFLLPKETAKKQLSSAAAKEVNKANTAVDALDRLTKELIGENGDVSKIWKAKIPLAPGARTYRGDWGSVIDVIGSFRTGASYTPAQRSDYAYMLPQIGDDDEVIKAKVKNVRKELEGYSNLMNNTSDTPQLDMGSLTGLGGL